MRNKLEALEGKNRVKTPAKQPQMGQWTDDQCIKNWLPVHCEQDVSQIGGWSSIPSLDAALEWKAVSSE